MASCAFEFWAYVVAHSRRLDDGRAQSLQLDDELAGRQKVAKALREQGYRIAIRMVQQTRNRDYEFWSRDEPQTRNRDYGFCSGDEQIRPIPWSEWGRNGAIHPVIRCDCDRHPEYC
jgi:hypothetical protein